MPSRPGLNSIWFSDIYLPRRRRIRLLAEITVALLPLLLFAVWSAKENRWDLFERAGSITTTVGLAIAAQRHIRLGVLEMESMHTEDRLRSNLVELRTDIIGTKIGFALSAFGTVIWGWGRYLHWWCFSFLIIWLLFIVHSARRDFGRLEDLNRNTHRHKETSDGR